MRYFISFSKLLMVIVWAILLSNLFFSFPEKAALIFYLLLGFMSIMHFMQTLIIYGAFAERFKLSRLDAFEIFIFGVFKLLQIKERFK